MICMDELSEVMYWKKQRMKDSILEYSDSRRKERTEQLINIEKKKTVKRKISEWTLFWKQWPTGISKSA